MRLFLGLSSQIKSFRFASPCLLWVCFLWLPVAAPTRAEEQALDPSLNERVIQVPGDPLHPVMLEVTVFSPNGPGPFPLAILNHGKELGKPKDEPRYRSAYIARYFLSRGYVVALPMMRGFAGSGGVFDPHGFDVEASGLTQAYDIAAVIHYMVRQPTIDGSRIIVSGQSFGGWNTLAFATLHYPGVKGALNFSGGMKEPLCPDWENNLIEAAGVYGARTQIPSLWFYGDNDSKFPAATWHSMFDRYTQAGGPATLVSYGSFMADAHNMLGSMEGFPLWMPKVDAFLVSLGLPGKLIDPRYLPASFPPPSHFAAVDDVKTVPYLNDKGRAAYRQFLTKSLPRVFIITPEGNFASFDGGYDPLTRGMGICRKTFAHFQLYAVDNNVVWTPPATGLGSSVAPKDSAQASQFRVLATKGDLEAERQLGYLYLTGYGVAANVNEGAKWIQLAAKQGDILSKGLQLRYGLGVPQNIPGAIAVYQQAAAKNDILAMLELSKACDSGSGIEQNSGQALSWLQKAADKGSATAQNHLGNRYQAGHGVPQDYLQAAAWYQKAADQGDAIAENDLGYLYLKGWGMNRDYAQAFAWFQKASDQGICAAQNQIGNMYVHGWGVPKDDGQAFIWFQKAADQGFDTSEYSLGFMYQNGMGVAKDNGQAKAWYQKAAAQGFVPAKQALMKMDTSSAVL